MPTFARLNLEGPLMAVAGSRIDGEPDRLPVPSAGWLAGLIGAAMGWRRGDDRLRRLRETLLYGIAVRREGTPMEDYQTAMIGQPHMRVGFRADGSAYERKGGPQTKVGAQEARRPLVADAAFVAVLTSPEFDADTIAEAVSRPVFPPYLGRRACVPTAPLDAGTVEAPSLVEAMRSVEDAERWWLPATILAPPPGVFAVPVTERRGGASLWASHPCS